MGGREESQKSFFWAEATTSLANPTWSPLQTNTLNGNSLYFTNPQWTNYPSRFYRVTWA
jgi:hypothetical protein